ncbi:MAG: GNAT family N-acetyltransferase [Spirochaetales bacterium]
MITYRPLTSADAENALALWKITPGVGISQGDTPEELSRFFEHNDGLCWAAVEGDGPGALLGTILCGNDGRRGYLYHLAVHEQARRTGIGRDLVERTLAALGAVGIQKCHAMVFANNASGRAFWQQVGWSFREDLVLFSQLTE